MKTLKLFAFIYLPLLVIGCEELLNLSGDSDLTTEEVVEGLKTALEIGTDTATTVLGLADGYYGSQLLKIPLPPEAEQVRELITNSAISQYFNLDDEFEDVVLAINRAAEEAAKEAGGVFKGAITDLSISDGWEILQGEVPSGLKSTAAEFDSTAATEYFKIKTYDTLTYMYGLKINDALDQPLSSLGFSATDAWTTLTNAYNTAYNTINSNFLTSALISQYNLPNGINDNLGEFCTEKALDGLFIKVGDEEKKIRRDPFQWAVDIIQKVFGSIV